jgi:acetyl-CoA carboxylase biotin carboxylase subunit
MGHLMTQQLMTADALIAWTQGHLQAIARMARALGELEVGGLPTTKPLHQALARDAEVQAGQFHTRWLEPWLDQNADRLGEEA